MVMSFAEAAKGTQPSMSSYLGRVINDVSPMSQYITVRDTGGARVYQWFTDKSLGENQWTAINEEADETHGESNEFLVTVASLQRKMKVDKRLANQPSKAIQLKAAEVRRAGTSYGLDFTDISFNGSIDVDRKQPNGMKAIIDAMIAQTTMPDEQKLDFEDGPPTLALMADLVSRVWPENNIALFVNRDVGLYYDSLVRDSSAAGYYRIEEDRDMFGKPIRTFGGYPVRVVMRTNNYATPLAFDEANSTCSMYAVSFDSDLGFFCVADGGIGMQAGPFVDLQTDTFLRSFTQQEYAFGMGGPRSVARGYGILLS